MKFDVTIGIPVYKSKDYIAKTMESALSQSFKSIEFLVIDDCGEDGSIEIVQRLQREHPRGKNIHILYNNQNCGVGVCRNMIIDNALGNYLYFLDSDDIIEPFAIQLLYDSILQYSVDVAYGSYDIIDCIANSPVEVYQKNSMVITKEDELATYVFKNSKIFHVSVCNCLINLSFLRNTNVRFVDAQYWEDFAFTYEFVPYVKCAVLFSDITYHYLRRGGSLSHYEVRDYIEKKEIINNLSVISYIKKVCNQYKVKEYLPYLCYNLEVNIFYMICNIIKNYLIIFPNISVKEMHCAIRHPLSLSDILQFRKKLLPNLLFWFLGAMPTFIFYHFILFLAKLKKLI